MARRSKESIQRQLKVLYRNLDEFEERRAKFGINAPIDLVNQIHDVRDEINRLEELLNSESFAADILTDAAPPGDDTAQPAQIQTLDDRDWDSLLRRIQDGNCTPFIGPEVYDGIIPADHEIAQSWAEEHAYPLGDVQNLPRVAQFLATTRDPAFPTEEIARRLKNNNARPNFRDGSEPHSFLAGLPLPIYITANYDDFMMQALDHRLRAATRELCRWNSYVKEIPSVFDPGSNFEAGPARPVVFHLFGHTQAPESMVLTEDDYLDFLVAISRRAEIIPLRIQKALVKTSLLFIGFQLNDLRFRVLFRGIIASLERSLRRIRIAVQVAPKPGQIEGITEDDVRWYLEDYLARDDVRVYWGSSFDFIKELKERWEIFNDRE